MHGLITKRCWLSLSLLSSACARPQYIARTYHVSACRKILTVIAALEGIQTGPYHTYNCGTHTPEVSILINTLIATLQRVLDDVSQTSSSPAYTAFFKNIASAPTVYNILSNITTGAPISPGPHAIPDAPPGLFGIPITPQFVCVTDYEQITWSLEKGGEGGKQLDAYTACTQSPVHAFSVFGTRFLKNSIILCPVFWTYAAIPPSSKSTCLRVDPHFNRFRDDGKRLTNYQLWVILHELAHSYIYAHSGSLMDLYTSNDCMSLSTSSAVNNAQNYVYYAASELISMTLAWLSSIILHIYSHRADERVADIWLGCTNFPIHRGSVELMEIDDNTTLSGGSRFQNVSVFGGQSIGNTSTGTSVGLRNVVDLAPWPA